MVTWAVQKEEAMSRKQCVLAVVIGIACLATLAVWVDAGKPPRPPQVPADPHIAFHTVREILVCNEDGQRLTTVYSAGRTGFAGHPSLSPALDAVVFNELNLSQVIRVDFSVVNGDVVTGAPRVLYDGYGAADNCGGPHWSPDGARIVVQCYDGDGHFHIGVMPADGVLPGEAPVTAYTFAPGMTMGDHAIWNTAGDGVIFSTCVEGVAGSCVLEELWLDGDGYPIGEPVVILSDPMFGDEIKNLSAAKTRNNVAFNSLGGGYILDLGTGAVTLAFAGSWPVWSPDDTQMLVVNRIHNHPRFQKVTLATGEIVTMDFGGNQPDWK